jgi:hypothetical protein
VKRLSHEVGLITAIGLPTKEAGSGNTRTSVLAQPQRILRS